MRKLVASGRVVVLAFAFASASTLAACGYRPVHSGAAQERLAVVRASSSIPDAVASDEVLAGVRDELARAGALAPGDGYPRCEVEILRADEASEGISAVTGPDGKLSPASRATRVGLVARAWLARKPGEVERDTGDVRAFEDVSVAPDARAASFRQTDALRAAARRVGRRLGARILGFPAASED
jgi:hypothetical protein